MLCFLRVLSRPDDRGRLIAFALAGALALLTHYFAVFLLAPMVLWLLWRPETRRRCLPGARRDRRRRPGADPADLGPGRAQHQLDRRWPLRARLEAIPQYFLTGYNGGAARPLDRAARRAAAAGRLRARAVAPDRGPATAPAGAEREAARRGAATGVAPRSRCGSPLRLRIPLVLALGGADYLAPRNVARGDGAGRRADRRARHLAADRPFGRGAARARRRRAARDHARHRPQPAPAARRLARRSRARFRAGGPERAIHHRSCRLRAIGVLHPGPEICRAHRSVRCAKSSRPANCRCARRRRASRAGFRLVEAHGVNGLIVFRFVAATPQRRSEEQSRARRRRPWRNRGCSCPGQRAARRARLAFQHGAVDPGGSQRGSIGARGGPRASALAAARGAAGGAESCRRT